jgi:hypothetical protein
MYIIFVVNEFARSRKDTGFVVSSFTLSDGESMKRDPFCKLAIANKFLAIITYIQFWTMIECGLGVMVVCLPTLQRPIRAVFIKMSPTSIISAFRSAFTTPSLTREAANEPSVYLLDRLDRSGKPSTSRSNVYAASDGVRQTDIAVAPDLERNEEMRHNIIHVQHEVEQY